MQCILKAISLLLQFHHRPPRTTLFSSQPAQRSLARRAIAGLALLGSMMTLLAMPASANNEISNFGPLMCPADETGHLQDKAARQISHEW